jgi:archaemetzincin
LYDTAPDLFVAGMAAGGSKVAVFSFARYQPEYLFCREKWWNWLSRHNDTDDTKQAKKSKKSTKKESKKSSSSSSSSDSERRTTMLRRSAKLLVHELGHLYGVGHCTWYHCVMNGSGHLAEDHSQVSKSLHIHQNEFVIDLLTYSTMYMS